MSWWDDDLEAHRQGFGVVLHLINGEWIVHRPLLGSPAEAAGVLKGDVLHALNGAPIAQSLRPTKLTASIEVLDPSIDHNVVFRRAQALIAIAMQPRILRDLFAADDAAGGAALGVCYSCPSCYSRTSGVASCPGDCPGYNCTTG